MIGVRWSHLLPPGLRPGLGARRLPTALLVNSGWLLLDKGIRVVVGLLVGVWVARYLGPDRFGVLAYALAYVAMFQAFATVSADSLVVRDLSQDPNRAGQLLGSAFVLRVGAGLVCWVAAVGACVLISEGDGQALLLVAIVGGTLVFQAADVVDLWFQSRSQSRAAVLAKLSAHLCSSGLKVALILAQAPLLAFAAVTAMEALASGLALAVAYRRLRVRGRWTASAATMRALVRQAWPLVLSGFAVMVYMRIDQIMIKELLGARELGLYAAVLPVSQVWQAIPMALAASIAPFLARQRPSDAQGYARNVVLIFRAFFYAGVAAAVVTLVLSRFAIELLFGAEYVPASAVLAVHGLANVFCFLGVAHSLWLTNEGHFSVRLYGTLLAGLATIGLNWVLLPTIGLVGAAWSAVAAQCLAAFLVNAVLDRRGFALQLAAIGFRKA